MLSPSEKEQFKMFESLDPKVRSNLVFRISKKIKKCLADLDEIDEVLRILPEKTARRLLSDDIINSMLTLSEDSIKILGYSPVKYDTLGRAVVVRKSPIKSKAHTFEMTYDLASEDDIARMRLIEDHIKTLNYVISMDSGFPVWHDSASQVALDSGTYGVDQTLRRWSRPRIHNYNTPEGHSI
ncbi:hypothetical protein [Methanothrix soehngenii]|uniref:hypothetical protein n=1 Tax=Methanothrix soehngenii TaxID=2223 RepID=UPI00300C1FA3